MERKPTVAEISPDKSSSPIEFTGSSVKPLSTLRQIKENCLFFQSTNGSSEKQLPNENEVQDQQFKDESRSPAGAEEVQVGIFPLPEAIKKASDLSCEKKMLQSHNKNLQKHVSAVEEQLEQKQDQCEMVNSQLKDKEQRLKESIEYISALEELMRIKDGRHSSALKKACLDHDSVKKELESCTNECIGYLNQLLEAQADGKAIEKDKLALEENVNVTIGALQVEIQQLKLHLETSSAELSAAGEKALQFQEENEVLRTQLDSLQYLKDSEENLRLDLTKIQQELDSERAEHTATEILAEEKLSGTKNALEFQVNELQKNLEVVQHQNESIKQELYSERSAHNETKTHLGACQNQLEEGRNRYLLELSKVQNTVNILKDEKNALQSEVDKFQANLFVASSPNESLKKGVGVDEEDSLSDGPSKKARLLDQSSSSICLAPQAKLIRGSENYSSAIEVDVGGPDNEMFSRASSFGSLIPKSRLPRKRKCEGRKELFKLLNDECKELRRKGLEDLSFIPIFHSSHRVTRCRPKSQPLMSGKR